MALALADQTHQMRAWNRVGLRLSYDRDAVDDILYVMVPITWLSSPLFALGGSSCTTLRCRCLWGLWRWRRTGRTTLTACRGLWAWLAWWTRTTISLWPFPLLSLALWSICSRWTWGTFPLLSLLALWSICSRWSRSTLPLLSLLALWPIRSRWTFPL